MVAANEPASAARQAIDGVTAKTEARRQPFRVDRLLRHRRILVVQHRAERPSANAGRDRRAHEVENRRQQIDVLHGRDDAASGALAVRLLDDERHVQRGVGERRDGLLVAVIADEKNRRLVVEVAILQFLHDAGDGFVGRPVVHLHEQQVALVVLRAHPAFCRVDRLCRVALGRRCLAVAVLRQLRVEKREALRDARTRAAEGTSTPPRQC